MALEQVIDTKSEKERVGHTPKHKITETDQIEQLVSGGS